MLDPALCTHTSEWNSFSHYWLVLKSLLVAWLLSPPLVALPLACMIAVPWMTKRIPWRRQVSGLGTVLLLIYFLAQLPATISLATKGLVSFLPTDSGAIVDAIVVLGRGEPLSNNRVEVAAELWREHRAQTIFASGIGDAPQMLQLLRSQGIPRQVLAGEDCSRTTQENAYFTATELKPQGVKRILLVTDLPHMWRAMLTYRSYGFEVIPHPSPLPSNLAPIKEALIVFYEYAGLVSYGLQGHFLPHSLSEVQDAQFNREILNVS
ncbi:MAG: YdcF family protein [Chroococcidiopsidaceae cyanobacterium CP_BM_RX_35]|nr:YdcF family protein [Chroococcidiopsidaceae cyanobacterium CP_BM_RX_35]